VGEIITIQEMKPLKNLNNTIIFSDDSFSFVMQEKFLVMWEMREKFIVMPRGSQSDFSIANQTIRIQLPNAIKWQ